MPLKKLLEVQQYSIALCKMLDISGGQLPHLVEPAGEILVGRRVNTQFAQARNHEHNHNNNNTKAEARNQQENSFN